MPFMLENEIATLRLQCLQASECIITGHAQLVPHPSYTLVIHE